LRATRLGNEGRQANRASVISDSLVAEFAVAIDA
jgi:hypothetical protein